GRDHGQRAGAAVEADHRSTDRGHVRRRYCTLAGGALTMDDESILFLLALGPASAAGLYWMLYRYYRNTDKSHGFEHETEIVAQPITGMEADRKVDEVRGTQATQIAGNNVGDWRRRVKRL